VVDDDKIFRDVLKHLCESMNCEVVTAADGQEAFELIHKQEFTIVISDVRMPNMSGVTLLEAIEKNGYDIPVIIMSGYTDYTADEIDQRNGVVLMEKPFSAQQLKEIIEQYIPFLPGRAS
jgi:DNA-binding NtrC family response regulator